MESLGLIMLLTWKKDKVGGTEGVDLERPSEEERCVMSLRDVLEEKWSGLL